MWRQCVVLFPQEGFSHSQRDRGRERFHLEAVGDDEKWTPKSRCRDLGQKGGGRIFPYNVLLNRSVTPWIQKPTGNCSVIWIACKGDPSPLGQFIRNIRSHVLPEQNRMTHSQEFSPSAGRTFESLSESK